MTSRHISTMASRHVGYHKKVFVSLPRRLLPNIPRRQLKELPARSPLKTEPDVRPIGLRIRAKREPKVYESVHTTAPFCHTACPRLHRRCQRKLEGFWAMLVILHR